MKKLAPALVTLVLVLLMVYTAAWFWFAGKIEEQANLVFSQGIQRGWILYGTPPRVSGFPGLFEISCSGVIKPVYEEISIPALHIKSLFLPGHDLEISMPKGFQQTYPEDKFHLFAADKMLIETAIPEQIPPDLTEGSVRIWHDAAGRIELRQLSLNNGNLYINGSGNLFLDEDLQPAGTLTLSTTGHLQYLQNIGKAELLNEKQMAITSAVMAALTKDGVMNVPLMLQNRTILVGPVRAASLPRIVWPRPLTDTHNPPALPQ